VKRPVQGLQQFVDVFVGALHRRQATGVLAGERFGARSEERDEQVFADQRPQGCGAAPEDPLKVVTTIPDLEDIINSILVHGEDDVAAPVELTLEGRSA